MSTQKSASPPAEPGLRERKKQQTRLAISDVATKLFIERGFENVTVAEVADAANVSVNTVFNYFTTKEELFFDRGPEVEEAPTRVIRERHRGESAVAALRRSFRKLLKPESRLFGSRMQPFIAAVDASPALQAHARLLLADTERSLLATLVAETRTAPDDPTARALAAMISGVYALLIQEFRRGVIAGEADASRRAALMRLGERGFELLLAAAGDYAVRGDDA
jgi:AcrR family transcriptional regulator